MQQKQLYLKNDKIVPNYPGLPYLTSTCTSNSTLKNNIGEFNWDLVCIFWFHKLGKELKYNK